MIRLFLTDGNFLACEALRTKLGAASELGVLARGDLINEHYMARALDPKAHDLTTVAAGRPHQAGGELLAAARVGEQREMIFKNRTSC